MKIVANAKEHNKVRARLFAFGVGYDVNSRLLDKLVRENFGQSEYVRPDEDIEDRVSRLYQPDRVAGDDRRADRVRLRRTRRPRRASRSTASIPRARSTCSPASSWWWSAATRSPATAKVVVSGTVGEQGAEVRLPGQARREERRRQPTASSRSSGPSAASARSSTRLDLKGKNDELVKELVELATRHGILTPYTSFLADESTNVHDLAGNAAPCRAAARGALETAGGQSGFGQRALKGELQRSRRSPPAARAGR